jgi:hypothetical protein
MSRIQFVPHSGKRSLYLDFSGCKTADFMQSIGEAKKLISSQPQGSVLILTNVSDVGLTKETSALMKDFATHNKHFSKASAVVGVEGLKKIIYAAVQRVSGRNIPSFDNPDQAKDWLASQ